MQGIYKTDLLLAQVLALAGDCGCGRLPATNLNLAVDTKLGDFQVLELREREQWAGKMDRLRNPVPDIHYRPEYCALFRDAGEPMLFEYREGRHAIYYPYLLRPINLLPGLGASPDQGLYDITSPYGYGGPLPDGAPGDSVWRNFYRCFAEYCREQNVITEFIRFHPLLGNHRPLSGVVPVERVSSVVVLDLNRSGEEIWAEYGRNNRKNINKALREGVRVLIEETPEHFTDFMHVYRHTLERNRAGAFYYFNQDFFQSIHCEMQGRYIYAHAYKGDDIISSELLLFNGTYLHSYLGGTLEQYFSLRPNNLLKHEAALWAQSRGINYFLLGGGHSDNDGIFRYKRSFAPGGVLDFYVGKQVHNKVLAEELARLVNANSQGETKGYFPAYRRCQ